MAIIKDLVDLGAEIQKLRHAYERLDALHQSVQYRVYELEEETIKLKKSLKELTERLPTKPSTGGWFA